MTTHATIIVAVVFGLFSILRIALDVGILGNLLFSVIYFSLAVLGDYEINRWKYYGDQAKKLADKLFKDKLERKERDKTYLHWIFVRSYIFYWLFVVLSFIGVYASDIIRLLCSIPKSLL